MRVLHVSPGLPPIRSGGMTRYCKDVIDAQISLGHDVALLYPGRIKNGSPRIEARSLHGLTTYELVNPLPVAFSFGVSDPACFTKCLSDASIFQNVLNEFAPDVVHVHEIMGIYREFFVLVKKMEIPLIYTTHDYYPICLRCTFMNNQDTLCMEGPQALRCAQCNWHSGMTFKRSKIMQSTLFEAYKRAPMIHGFIKRAIRFAGRFKPKNSKHNEIRIPPSIEADYSELIEYNRDILSMMDLVLANSPQSKEVYSRFVDPKSILLVPITHADIVCCNTQLKKEKAGVIFAYFGGPKAYKGFSCLIEAFKLLEKDNPNYRLVLYGSGYPKLNSKNISIRNSVSSDKISETMSQADVVVVPSKCPETFGFIVLEGLAASRQVVCSNLVGARNLANPLLVFKYDNVRDLRDKMKKAAVLSQSGASVVLPVNYPLDIKTHSSILVEQYGACIDRMRQC